MRAHQQRLYQSARDRQHQLQRDQKARDPEQRRLSLRRLRDAVQEHEQRRDDHQNVAEQRADDRSVEDFVFEHDDAEIAARIAHIEHRKDRQDRRRDQRLALRLRSGLHRLYGRVELCKKIDLLKQDLISFGYDLLSSEPLKITIDAKNYGYVGEQIVKILIKNDIYVEFYDDDYVVLMLTPELIDSEIEKVKQVLLSICKKTKIEKKSLPLVSGKRVLSLTEASASLSKIVDTKNSLGEIYQDFMEDRTGLR